MYTCKAYDWQNWKLSVIVALVPLSLSRQYMFYYTLCGSVKANFSCGLTSLCCSIKHQLGLLSNDLLLPTAIFITGGELDTQNYGEWDAFHSKQSAAAFTKQNQKTARGYKPPGSGALGCWVAPNQEDILRSRGQTLKCYGNTVKESGGKSCITQETEKFSIATDHNSLENSRKPSILK